MVVVIFVGLINVLKFVGKKFSEIKVVISGVGVVGIVIVKIFYSVGVKEIVIVDRKGIIYEGREDFNLYKCEVVEYNVYGIEGGLKEVMEGVDVFIGVSVGGIVILDMVRVMVDDVIVFVMVNLIFEIMLEEVKRVGVRIVVMGRSDFLN